MSFQGPEFSGDLPPDHPLVLEALKGIISGPISELRTKVDNLITNPSAGLQKGSIDYNKILPTHNAPTSPQLDKNIQISNDIINQISPTQYMTPNVLTSQQVPVVNYAQVNTNDQNDDQLELPLFKKTEVSDLYKKLFDIEAKLDIIIKHVKNSSNKKQG
jgi:hypothetical protein